MSEQLLKEILGELKSLKEGQMAFSQRLQTVEESQKSLAAGQMALSQRLQTVEGSILSLNAKITKIEIHIEAELVNKVRALFDGYSLRGDQVEKLREHFDERLDMIALDINYLVRKTAQNETAIRELKRAR